MKSGTKENVQNFHSHECRTQKERPCNSLILLAKVRAIGNTSFRLGVYARITLEGQNVDE